MVKSGRISRLRLSPAEIGVFIFTAAYMAVSLLTSALLKNEEFLFYFLVMCVLIAVVAVVHFRVRLHLGAIWGLSIWGLAHMAGGLMPVPESWPIHREPHVLYNWWLVPGVLKYDQVVHAFGFGVVTWICWQGLRTAFQSRGISVKPTVGLLVLCVAGGMGFGAANEMVEFIATRILPGTNVGGYANTGWDLVANFVGCLIAAITIYASSRVVGRDD
jgi:hypothetical protein